jgi:hypothetical protein
MPSVHALKSVHTQKHQPEVDSLYHANPVIELGEYLIPAYVVNNKNIENVNIYDFMVSYMGNYVTFNHRILRKTLFQSSDAAKIGHKFWSC